MPDALEMERRVEKCAVKFTPFVIFELAANALSNDLGHVDSEQNRQAIYTVTKDVVESFQRKVREVCRSKTIELP